MNRSVPFGRLSAILLSGVLVLACGGQDLDDKSEAPLDGALRARENHDADKTTPVVLVSNAMTSQFALAADDAEPDDETRVIAFGESAPGSMAWDDAGNPIEVAFDFSTDAVVTAVIDVVSSDFDPMVVVADADGYIIGQDDDGGEGLNSRLTLRLTDAGKYTIVVTAYGLANNPPQAFTVSLAQEGAGGTTGGPGTYSGSLDQSDDDIDGRFFDLYPYTGTSGEEVTVSVASTDFDTYVGVIGGNIEGAFDVLGENDDANGTTNSEVTVRLPSGGNYAVMVTSYSDGEFGAYDLTISSAPGGAGGGSATRPPGGVTAQGTGDPDDSYALIVGIDDYPGFDSDLAGPAGDARLMRDMLIDVYGFNPENILMLYDQDATRDNIATGFAEHLGQAGPNGSTVFFYSGHGTQLDENIGLTAPVDNESNGLDEALYVYGADYRSSVLLDDEIGFLADQLRSDHTLIVIDACYSGTVSRGPGDSQAKFIDAGSLGDLVLPNGLAGGFAAASSKTLSDIFDEPQRHVLLAASTEDELSWTAGTPDGRTEPVSAYAHILDLVVRSMPDSTLEAIGLEARRLTLQFQAARGSEPQTPQVIGRSIGTSMREYVGGN